MKKYSVVEEMDSANEPKVIVFPTKDPVAKSTLSPAVDSVLSLDRTSFADTNATSGSLFVLTVNAENDKVLPVVVNENASSA